MARTPNPKLHAIWRHIRRQEAGGLTIEQFCSQEGIARSKFHSWDKFPGTPSQTPAGLIFAPSSGDTIRNSGGG